MLCLQKSGKEPKKPNYFDILEQAVVIYMQVDEW